jgi:tRNA(Ile)-lysidine synthase
MTINYLELSKFFSELPSRVAIATSGGADSMCLALLAQRWSRQFSVKIVCLIVNHNLRLEAGEEARVTADFLNKQGIETHILEWVGDKPVSGIQKNAREARYGLLCEWCNQNNVKILLTAHNMHDQAETVLMRIQHGTGIDGLAGIPIRTRRQGVEIIRPLLQYSRQQIIATLQANKWPHIEDPSNHNNKFTRVKIRQLLEEIDAENLLSKRLNTLANNAARTLDFINNYVNKILKNLAKKKRLGYITLDLGKFIKLEEEIALRVLCRVLNYFSNKDYVPRLESLVHLYGRIKETVKFHATLAGCEIMNSGNQIIIWRERVNMENKTKTMQELPVGKEMLWDNRFIIKANEDNLFVRQTNLEDWQIIKKKSPNNFSKLENSRIVYSTPAICDKHGELVAHPLFDYYLAASMRDKLSISLVELC